MAKSQKKPRERKPRERTHFYAAKDERLFTLNVILDDGLMTEEFVKANKKVSRKIEMRGDNTLAELHEAIYEAFDRDDPHMFEFRFNEKIYMDNDAKRYVLPFAMEDFWDNKPAGDVTMTTIGSLDLKEKDTFNYWFDFGDDWWHTVEIISIGEKAPGSEKKYPKITEKVGDSPPQYLKWDDDEE